MQHICSWAVLACACFACGSKRVLQIHKSSISFLCQKKFLPASDSACLRTAGGVGRVHVQHAEHAGEAVRLVPAKQPLDEAVLGVRVGEALVTINTVTTNRHLRGIWKALFWVISETLRSVCHNCGRDCIISRFWPYLSPRHGTIQRMYPSVKFHLKDQATQITWVR